MTGALPSGDQAAVTVHVAVSPRDAFEVFTEEIDRWWRRGAKFRVSGRLPGIMRLEPELGGRLFETIDGPEGAREVVTGRVTAWEPPSRLAFEWRGVNFGEGERTEVEVAFDAVGDGTRVRLVHRGWASLRDDHPARHGHVGAAFARFLGLWWGELMTSYRGAAAEPR